MPTKRQPLRRARHGITPQAIEAYRERDYMRLHRALGLKPWECSPLPGDPLGVDQFERPHYVMDSHGWETAQRLQRELEAMK